MIRGRWEDGARPVAWKHRQTNPAWPSAGRRHKARPFVPVGFETGPVTALTKSPCAGCPRCPSTQDNSQTGIGRDPAPLIPPGGNTVARLVLSPSGAECAACLSIAPVSTCRGRGTLSGCHLRDFGTGRGFHETRSFDQCRRPGLAGGLHNHGRAAAAIIAASARAASAPSAAGHGRDGDRDRVSRPKCGIWQ